MSLEAREDKTVTFDALRRLKRLQISVALRLRKMWRAIGSRFSSSLTRRIVVLNLGGLVALAFGFLYLNQFREGLIDARVQSLQTQGEIIAAAVAASATVETDAITIDPEKLLQLAPGESYGVTDESQPSLEFSINPERIGPVLRRLVSPTRTRARIYDRDGYMLLDSRSLTSRSNILRYDLPPETHEESLPLIERSWNAVKGRFGQTGMPLYEEREAVRIAAINRPGQCEGRDHRLRSGSDPEAARRAWRVAAFDAGWRYRFDHRLRTMGDSADFSCLSRRHADPVALPGWDYRRADAAPGRSGRAGQAGHQVASANSRFH
jgi:hypothetical protein